MSTALTLYQIEDDLVAMLNSVDMVDDPEAKAVVEQEIIAQHLKAVEKRDKVSQFLAHCDNQEEFISKEIERLTELRNHFTATRDRVEDYIVFTIKALGKDDNDKWRKLDGRTCSFSIAKKPLSTEITSLDDLDDKFKDYTVKLSAEDWANFVGELDIEQREAFLGKLKSIVATPRKTEVKKALEAAADAAKENPDLSPNIPGARMSELTYRLNRK